MTIDKLRQQQSKIDAEDENEGMKNQEKQWEEENEDEENYEVNSLYSELHKGSKQDTVLPKFADAIKEKAEKIAAAKNAVRKDPFLKYGIGI